jgi:serine/threonine-protein kinase RsbW
LSSECKEVTLIVPMIPDMELAVTKTVDGLAGFIHFSNDQIDEIKHAIIEACMNATEHSHSKDRRLYLSFKVLRNQMQIQVEDRGSGFNPGNVENPSIEKKIFKNARKRGWGLKLISNFMDHVEIISSASGTIVTMIKFAGVNRKEAANG